MRGTLLNGTAFETEGVFHSKFEFSRMNIFPIFNGFEHKYGKHSVQYLNVLGFTHTLSGQMIEELLELEATSRGIGIRKELVVVPGK